MLSDQEQAREPTLAEIVEVLRLVIYQVESLMVVAENALWEMQRRVRKEENPLERFLPESSTVQ